MDDKRPKSASAAQLERELLREHQQRALIDDAKLGTGNLEEVRSKDARETVDSFKLRRQRGL
jgi:hypothetical protein